MNLQMSGNQCQINGLICLKIMAKSSLFCYKKDKEMINEIIVINEKDINVTRYVSSCQEFLLS